MDVLPFQSNTSQSVLYSFSLAQVDLLLLRRGTIMCSSFISLLYHCQAHTLTWTCGQKHKSCFHFGVHVQFSMESFFFSFNLQSMAMIFMFFSYWHAPQTRTRRALFWNCCFVFCSEWGGCVISTDCCIFSYTFLYPFCSLGPNADLPKIWQQSMPFWRSSKPLVDRNPSKNVM